MDDRLLMTPGPTAVTERVRERMREPAPNPDVEPEFADRYRAVRDKLADVYGTDDDLVILGGEGILGLEAAVASLIEPGDRVLCLSNGLYGDGFADFVETYDGDPVTVSVPYEETVGADPVADALADGSFDAATLVHCETPTGTLNDIEAPLEVLADHDVLTVVDAVSSLGGAPVPTEHVDVCIGASQKCFSAPPGLTTLSVSDAAWDRIEATETPSFYADLEPWRGVPDDAHFPYTHFPSNLAALDEALDAILEEGRRAAFDRHERVAAYCRERAAELGLELYAADEQFASPTVTALHVPGRASELQAQLRADHDVTLATGLGEFEDDILRVGHMGYNADRERVERTMDALEAVLDR